MTRTTRSYKYYKRIMAAAWQAIAALLVTMSAVRAQNCDLYQYVQNGAKYDITSPDYPNQITRSCRWRAEADANSQLHLTCNEFKIATSNNCQYDVLMVSLSGDNTMSDAHRYCGTGTFSHVSDANKLSMQLRTFYGGGRFKCTITAVAKPSTCRCGIKKQNRIVGGEETGVNEFPFICAFVDADIKEIFCGCTIVSAHYVLTAAHCSHHKSPERTGVLVGDHDITTGSDTKAAALYAMDRWIVHPYYNQGQPVEEDNDIALARTKKAIVMSNEVMPACLPINFQRYPFTNASVTVAGWGTTFYGGPTSNVLLKATLKVLSPQQCSAVYGDAVSNRQMCTYNKGKDACQMDSGGPLLCMNEANGLMYMIGVVSHGVGCATSMPGVNTRVTSYTDWITQTIGAEDSYCIY